MDAQTYGERCAEHRTEHKKVQSTIDTEQESLLVEMSRTLPIKISTGVLCLCVLCPCLFIHLFVYSFIAVASNVWLPLIAFSIFGPFVGRRCRASLAPSHASCLINCFDYPFCSLPPFFFSCRLPIWFQIWFFSVVSFFPSLFRPN